VSALRKGLHNPVTLMLLTGVLALAVIGVGTYYFGSRAAATQATYSSKDKTELLAATVVQPNLPRGLIHPRRLQKENPGALDKWHNLVTTRVLVDDILRIKIWRRDGTILYSDLPALIGENYPLGEEELDVLKGAPAEAEVSDLSAPENRFEKPTSSGLVEVYTRIRSPEGEPLLFEAYYSEAVIDRRRNDLLSTFWPVTFASMGLVLLVGTALLYALTRRLRRSAEERQRLLEAAVEASEAERVRIARDLHDGVVQDLVGASFAMSALARTNDLPSPAREAAEEAGTTVRSSLKALRSLMVEIYPPDLRAAGLGAALQDLLAPAAAQGVAATATVTDAEPASDAAVGLVWRVAQEAVRNSLRHSGARTLGVEVTGEQRSGSKRLVLTVTDDGSGFDPSAPPRAGHFGLRGLSSLARDAGGRLDVQSAVGQGTTIHLEIPAGAR
jgi:two-component system, NarL family, sensor kinase